MSIPMFFFYDLLDSALDDFGKLELGSAPKVVTDDNSCPVQGLGTGLPNLPPSKKKGKQKTGSSSASKPTSTDAHAETLEKLAHQTRDTLHDLQHSAQDEATGEKMVEDLFKQFEDLGGSQVRVAESNNIRSQLNAINRKQSGSMAVRDLSNIVKAEDMISSEHLTTLLAVVPKYSQKDWLSSYEALSTFVV